MYWCPSQPVGWKWQEKFSIGSGYATLADSLAYSYEVRPDGTGELILSQHTIPFSYGYNDWGACPAFCYGGKAGLGGDVQSGGWPHVRISEVRQPANMFAISDSTSVGSWDFNIDPTSPGGAGSQYPAKIHDGGANMLFADGHVEWYLQEDLVIGNTNYNSWNESQREIGKRWNTHFFWHPNGP